MGKVKLAQNEIIESSCKFIYRNDSDSYWEVIVGGGSNDMYLAGGFYGSAVPDDYTGCRTNIYLTGGDYLLLSPFGVEEGFNVRFWRQPNCTSTPDLLIPCKADINGSFDSTPSTCEFGTEYGYLYWQVHLSDQAKYGMELNSVSLNSPELTQYGVCNNVTWNSPNNYGRWLNIYRYPIYEDFSMEAIGIDSGFILNFWENEECSGKSNLEVNCNADAFLKQIGAADHSGSFCAFFEGENNRDSSWVVRLMLGNNDISYLSSSINAEKAQHSCNSLTNFWNPSFYSTQEPFAIETGMDVSFWFNDNCTGTPEVVVQCPPQSQLVNDTDVSGFDKPLATCTLVEEKFDGYSNYLWNIDLSDQVTEKFTFRSMNIADKLDEGICDRYESFFPAKADFNFYAWSDIASPTVSLYQNFMCEGKPVVVVECPPVPRKEDNESEYGA